MARAPYVSEGDLTLEEAAVLCNSTEDALKKAIRAGYLQGQKKRVKGGPKARWYTTREAVDKYVTETRRKPGRPHQIVDKISRF